MQRQRRSKSWVANSIEVSNRPDLNGYDVTLIFDESERVEVIGPEGVAAITNHELQWLGLNRGALVPAHIFRAIGDSANARNVTPGSEGVKVRGFDFGTDGDDTVIVTGSYRDGHVHVDDIYKASEKMRRYGFRPGSYRAAEDIRAGDPVRSEGDSILRRAVEESMARVQDDLRKKAKDHLAGVFGRAMKDKMRKPK